jgi:ElaB/YqjD/DUF883 family membrane-anchored ribosome-binding protein
MARPAAAAIRERAPPTRGPSAIVIEENAMTSLEEGRIDDTADDASAGASAAASVTRATGRLGLALREAQASIGDGFCDAAAVLDDAFGRSGRELATALRDMVRARPLCSLAVVTGVACLIGRASRR